MPKLNITRWAAPLGAIVHDLDVRNLSEAEHAEINRLFC